jgi:hypothetical protein
LRSRFPENVKDIDWVTAIKGEDLVVVTVDGEMRTNSAERLALEDGQRVCVFLYNSYANLQFWPQAAFLVKHWPEIEKRVGKAKPGTTLHVSSGGVETMVEYLKHRAKRK